jgi:hypothetical protein
MRFGRSIITVAIVVAALAAPVVAGSTVAIAAEVLPPGGSFVDDNGYPEEGYIEAIAATGITKGCGLSEERLFCPDRAVTRAEMAAFIVRALELPVVTENPFVDTSESVHVWDIATLHSFGITNGCNAPDGDQFCPDRIVTRGQMAAFISRAFSLTGEVDTARYVDDDTSIFEGDISRATDAGIATGCDTNRYCPGAPMLRKTMAEFLGRARGLEPNVPPPLPIPTTLLAEFTTYYSACADPCRVTNIQLISDTVNGVVVQPGQVFSVNETVGQRTVEKGYVAAGAIIGGVVYCCDSPINIGGGTSQFATTLYNAVFFAGLEDVEHRPHSLYFSRYPMGREATLNYTSPDLKFRNNTTLPVTIVVEYTETSITVKLLGQSDVVGVESFRTGNATFADGGRVTVERVITFVDNRTESQIWTWTYRAGETESDTDGGGSSGGGSGGDGGDTGSGGSGGIIAV